MKVVNSGFLVCLICIYFMMIGKGTWLYTVGGYLFWVGVAITIVGIVGIKKRK